MLVRQRLSTSTLSEENSTYRTPSENCQNLNEDECADKISEDLTVDATEENVYSNCRDYVWLIVTLPLRILFVVLRLLYWLTKPVIKPIRKQFRIVNHRLQLEWNYMTDFLETHIRRYILVPLAVRIINRAVKQNKSKIDNAKHIPRSFTYPKSLGRLCFQYIHMIYLIANSVKPSLKIVTRPAMILDARDHAMHYLREGFKAWFLLNEILETVVNLMRVVCKVLLIIADTLNFLSFIMAKISEVLWILYYLLCTFGDIIHGNEE